MFYNNVTILYKSGNTALNVTKQGLYPVLSTVFHSLAGSTGWIDL